MSKPPIKFIRNFSIIAHIDHGKSTLSDRLIQECGALEERDMQKQILDSMEIERERGITIKSQTVQLEYKANDGNIYQLNLMDTPGHVDFSYEVSRSLAACEGALLVVDSSQGVEAQTIANVYKALDCNLELITILNKIDLPAADPKRIKNEIEEVIGIDTSNAIETSAKTGQGIKDILEAIVKYIPPPQYKIEKEPYLQALLVDGWYDTYLGIILLVRIKEGSIKKGQYIKMLSTGLKYLVDSVGIFIPKKKDIEILNKGQIGFINAGIKELKDCHIGDTISLDNDDDVPILEGFKPLKSVVFCSIYPVDQGEFDKLKTSIAKLSLNDSSLEYQVESSGALGLGFRCGFLGMLHLEIVQERLEREYDLDIITTAPSVEYNIELNNGTKFSLHNPVDMPDPVKIKKMDEPWISATILVPDKYLGAILKLCTERRGIQNNLSYTQDRVMLSYELPLNEIIFDFYDQLKSISSGYASFDWEFLEYRESDLIKLLILVNGETVDALSIILHRSKAETRGRILCQKLKTLIPKQMFKVAIQAAIGGKIIARETVSALRKDVTAKCYGGDATRKKKLLEKQKKGKLKMREIGNVKIPKKAFIDALKIDNQ